MTNNSKVNIDKVFKDEPREEKLVDSLITKIAPEANLRSTKKDIKLKPDGKRKPATMGIFSPAKSNEKLKNFKKRRGLG